MTPAEEVTLLRHTLRELYQAVHTHSDKLPAALSDAERVLGRVEDEGAHPPSDRWHADGGLVVNDRGDLVATCEHASEWTRQADARLLARAPELYNKYLNLSVMTGELHELAVELLAAVEGPAPKTGGLTLYQATMHHITRLQDLVVRAIEVTERE